MICFWEPVEALANRMVWLHAGPVPESCDWTRGNGSFDTLPQRIPALISRWLTW